MPLYAMSQWGYGIKCSMLFRHRSNSAQSTHFKTAHNSHKCMTQKMWRKRQPKNTAARSTVIECDRKRVSRHPAFWSIVLYWRVAFVLAKFIYFDVIYKFNSIHKQRKNVHVCSRIILHFIRNNASILSCVIYTIFSIRIVSFACMLQSARVCVCVAFRIAM